MLNRDKHFNIPVAVRVAIIEIALKAGLKRHLVFIILQQGIKELIPRGCKVVFSTRAVATA